MQNSSVKRQTPFPFILEELASIRPAIKRMFGCTYVYLDAKLLFSLRDSVKHPGSNGMWLFTTTEHGENLRQEFPGLSRRQLWRSGKNAWVILASRLENFEEFAFRACELILRGDPRIGRVTRGGSLGGRRQEAGGRRQTAGSRRQVAGGRRLMAK
ncbi:MAG: hypothetical protein ACREBG_27590 [Pyrinomonadaceae bacterium]